MKTQEKFGQIIKELRLQKALSQEQLAFEANIDWTYISDIERGSRNISLEMIIRLSEYFQISLSDLFKMVEDYGNIK